MVVRRGAEEAGAVFITIDRLDGTLDLYAPAPQSTFDEGRPSDRKFQRVETGVDGATIAARLSSETRFDPDVWMVAIEDRAGRTFFDVV